MGDSVAFAASRSPLIFLHQKGHVRERLLPAWRGAVCVVNFLVAEEVKGANLEGCGRVAEEGSSESVGHGTFKKGGCKDWRLPFES